MLPTGACSKLQVGGTVSADLYICETTDGVERLQIYMSVRLMPCLIRVGNFNGSTVPTL